MPSAPGLEGNSEMSSLFGDGPAAPAVVEEKPASPAAEKEESGSDSFDDEELPERGMRPSFLARIGDSEERILDIEHLIETGEDVDDVDRTYQTVYAPPAPAPEPEAEPEPEPEPKSSPVVPALKLPDPEVDDLEESLDADPPAPSPAPAPAPAPAPEPASTTPSPSKAAAATTPQSAGGSAIKNAEVEEVGSDDELVMTDRSEGLGGRIYLPDGTYTSTTTNVDKEIEKLKEVDITSPVKGAGEAVEEEDMEESYEDSFDDEEEVKDGQGGEVELP